LRPSYPLQVRLTFDDTRKRFGFMSLDRVYDTAAMLVLASSIGVLLQANNSAKDYGGYWNQEVWGKMLPVFVTAIVIFTIVFLPVLIFGNYADSARKREDARLAQAIDKCPEGDAKEKLCEKRCLLEEQRAWPAKDRLFWVLLGLSFISMVLFPLGMNSIGPEWFHGSIQWTMHSLPKLLCGCE
jgi:hypothetical protein